MAGAPLAARVAGPGRFYAGPDQRPNAVRSGRRCARRVAVTGPIASAAADAERDRRRVPTQPLAAPAGAGARQGSSDDDLDRRTGAPRDRRRSWSTWTRRPSPNTTPSASSAARQDRDGDRPRPAGAVPPGRPRAAHTGPAIRATSPQTVAAWTRPIARIPGPEGRDQEVVGARPRVSSPTSPRSAPVGSVRGRRAEDEGDAEPDADRIGRDEQAVRPGELVGEPGAAAEERRRRGSTCRSPATARPARDGRAREVRRCRWTRRHRRRRRRRRRGSRAGSACGSRAPRRPARDRRATAIAAVHEPVEQRMRALRPALELRVELAGHEPRVVAQLDDLHEPAVGREPGQEHARAPRASGGSGCSPRTGGGAARR